MSQRPQALRAVSLLSENADPCFRAVCDHLSATTGLATVFDTRLPWEARESELDQGRVQVGFVCGLLFARKRARTDLLHVLAAPVMAAERYQDLPIYFSDVVVRADDPARSFDQLRGRRWAYNEPGSFSGYALTAHELWRRGKPRDFFAKALQAGSHLESLRMVRDGRADGAAIDSSVLDLARRNDPSIEQALRVIESFGPNPHPPVVAYDLPEDERERLTAALCAMHQHPEGRQVLALGGFKRFDRVRDSDYDGVREIGRAVDRVRFAPP